MLSSIAVLGCNRFTKNLLIKSQPFFVHRRVQQSTTDTILRLKAKIVTTGQK